MTTVPVRERRRCEEVQCHRDQCDYRERSPKRAWSQRRVWLVHGTVKGPVVVLLCPPDEQVTVYVPVPLPVLDTVWYVQLMLPLASAR